ncbi:hypothetical protein [Haloarcula litorea]|uniref:hypothetical protein n=1 Tax=Haloarcula litorea TaxID=3032579 RepID=UPI0023E8E5F6|nr:hypothetical protein [Halomicroarcula sp. GDY20]
MGRQVVSPGPAAAHAFSLGLKAGAILGLGTIGGLYWAGVIDLLFAGYALVCLFPVYLVVLAAGLSVWLGYDKDATALRPVYRQE